MNKVEFNNFIDTFKFRKYADIVSSGRHAIFENKQVESTDSGYVYLWIERNRATFTVVYVGKAGKTMRKRCNEQVAGFKGGSKIGKTHSNNILKGIKEGKHCQVYARKSETKKIVDVPGISLCCAEETAFIKKFNSTIWNKNKTL